MTGSFIEQVRLIASQRDFYNAEAMLRESRERGFSYRKREHLVRAGKWRGVDFPRLRDDLAFRKYRVVISGHSDIPVSVGDALLTRTIGARAVFAQNVAFDLSLAQRIGVHAIPIGPQAEDDKDTMLSKEAEKIPDWGNRHSNIYSNFNPSTAPKHRLELLSYVSSLRDIVVVGSYSYSRDGRLNFLRELSQFRYFLAPQGNGLDSHRVWEGLCLGSVPVVLANSYSHRLLTWLGLPVVGVADWSDLGKKGVVDRFDDFLMGKPFSATTLRLSHWLEGLEEFRL